MKNKINFEPIRTYLLGHGSELISKVDLVEFIDQHTHSKYKSAAYGYVDGMELKGYVTKHPTLKFTYIINRTNLAKHAR